MKKLMFAMAVMAAGAAMADVTSANVVGYQELATDLSGKAMVVPTFLNVGESNKVSLADLKVTGYKAPEKNNKGKWIYGCQANEFIATKLTNSGTTESNYHWLDTGTVGPGWFADETGTAIAGGAASVKFDAGTGFWISGNAYKLVPAGAVNTFDVSCKTDVSGKSAIGNSMPIDIPLADLTVTGYKPPEKNNKGKWIYGCQANEFIATKLKNDGTTESNYHWLDTGTVGPGWFADETGTPIEGGADKVVIPAGLGLWISGSGYTINIPAPELDAKKED